MVIRSIGSTNILDWKKLGMLGVITSGGLADSDEIHQSQSPRLSKGKDADSTQAAMKLNL
jgi:hypothetical protein